MQDTPLKHSRRGFFFGAAASGTAAAALISLKSTPEALVKEEKLKPAPEHGGGYSLSDHVKRYYKTTRV